MDERIEKELYIYIDDAISSLMIWPYISVTRNTPLFLFHTFVVPSLFYHPFITPHIAHHYYPYSFPPFNLDVQDGRTVGQTRKTRQTDRHTNYRMVLTNKRDGRTDKQKRDLFLFLSFSLSFFHSFILSFFHSFILSFFHSFFLSFFLSLSLFLSFFLSLSFLSFFLSFSLFLLSLYSPFSLSFSPPFSFNIRSSFKPEEESFLTLERNK